MQLPEGTTVTPDRRDDFYARQMAELREALRQAWAETRRHSGFCSIRAGRGASGFGEEV